MNEIFRVFALLLFRVYEASKFPQFKFQKFKHDAQMEASIGQARTRDVTHGLTI